MSRLVLSVVVVSFVLVACGSGELVVEDLQEPEPAGIDRVSVASNALFAGTLFEVNVEVSNFTLDPDNYGGDKIDGHGHFHVYLDQISDGTKLVGSGETPAFVRMPVTTTLGDHTLIVTLQNNDHSDVEPAVRYEYPVSVIDLEMAPIVPVLTITQGTDFDVEVDMLNFILDDANYGGANIYGHGHYHVYLDLVSDATKLAGSGTAAKTVTMPAGTAAGAHQLLFTLQNNDHTPFEPETIRAVDVTVQ